MPFHSPRASKPASVFVYRIPTILGFWTQSMSHFKARAQSCFSSLSRTAVARSGWSSPGDGGNETVHIVSRACTSPAQNPLHPRELFSPSHWTALLGWALLGAPVLGELGARKADSRPSPTFCQCPCQVYFDSGPCCGGVHHNTPCLLPAMGVIEKASGPQSGSGC